MKLSFMRFIRFKLILLVVVSVMPALGVIAYSEWALRDALVRGAHEKSLMIVHGLSLEHELAVQNTRKLLLGIAKTREVQTRNVPRCNKLLAHVLADKPIYANIFLVNAEGTVFASGLPFKPHSITNRKYYQDAVKTGRLSVGEYVVGVTAKRPVLHLAQPVSGVDGRVRLLVVAAVDLARYGELFPHKRLPEGAILSLLDHKGVRIYRYPDAEKYSGIIAPSYWSVMERSKDEGAFRSIGPDGVKRLSAYKRFYLNDQQTPYLFLIVGIPEKEALGYVRRVEFVSALLFGLALFSAILLAWFVGRAVIVKRLRKLVRVSRELGRGNLAVRTGMDHETDELGWLAKSFDEMADSLEDKEAERKLAEDALRESQQKLAGIIEFLPDATFVIDMAGKVIGWNRAVEEMTGINKKDMIGQGDHAYTIPFYGYRRQQLLDLIDTNNAELESKYANVKRRGNTLYAEVFTPALYGGKGAYIWATGAPLFDDKGNRVGAIESMRDITARKQAEEQIKASLKEKEVLLKEVQHRVKNNLLTISGIFALQLNQMKDEESRSAFVTSMNRINAMTKIHTRFYQSEDYSLIDFKKYIEELLFELSRSYNFPSENMKTDIKDIFIDINTAIPAGLIVNELVSNAMKHAFPDGREGTVMVSLQRNGGDICLTVKDNGAGLPEDVDLAAAESVGMQLIASLAEQLEATVELKRDGGTEFTITFTFTAGQDDVRP